MKNINNNNIALKNALERVIELEAIVFNTLEERKQSNKLIKRKTFLSWLMYYVFYSCLKNFTANAFKAHEIDLYSIITNLIIKVGGKLYV